jgi:hypothetical protein
MCFAVPLQMVFNSKCVVRAIYHPNLGNIFDMPFY